MIVQRWPKDPRNRLCFSRFRGRSPAVPGAMLDCVIPAVWIGLGPLSPKCSPRLGPVCVKSLTHCEEIDAANFLDAIH